MNYSESDRKFIKNAVDASLQVGVIAVLIMWCYNIASPFMNLILWGIIIAIGTAPIYHWIKDKLGGKKGIAATVFTLLMIAVLIVPTVYFSEAFLSSTQAFSENLKNDVVVIPPPPDSVADWPLIGQKIDVAWAKAAADPHAFMGQYEPQVKVVANFLLKVVASISAGILMFLFAIILAGVFLANSEGCHAAAVKILTRFFGVRGERLTDLAHQTVQGVVKGIIGIAILQTVLAGLGFFAMDIPGAGILTIVCLILAVVQIDILIVLIPLSIYAFSEAGTGVAIAFLIWNIVVGLLNNVLKPILLGHGVKAPMAVVFIGAIGGMIAYGIIGLFVGAVVFVLGYTLFIDWVKEDDERAVGNTE